MAGIREYLKKIFAKRWAGGGKAKRRQLFGCGCCRSAIGEGNRECGANCV
jgi:hypothetical protein